MPDIAGALREEIARIARKELKTGMESVAKASSRHRAEIAELKRTITGLERTVAKLVKTQGATGSKSIVPSQGDDSVGFRYSAKSMASQRKRLGLSAAQMGQLLGVSGQTVYKWEEGEVRPRQSHFAAIAAMRAMGRREAISQLAQSGDGAGSAEAQD
ncbi:MAG: helix-turn-helix transcriptional regulator [Burkholderiales bacterium]|nr:helix-turn-helix transcriptional regulator [Burkholderiales bacterium]